MWSCWLPVQKCSGTLRSSELWCDPEQLFTPAWCWRTCWAVAPPTGQTQHLFRWCRKTNPRLTQTHFCSAVQSVCITVLANSTEIQPAVLWCQVLHGERSVLSYRFNRWAFGVTEISVVRLQTNACEHDEHHGLSWRCLNQYIWTWPASFSWLQFISAVFRAKLQIVPGCCVTSLFWQWPVGWRL